MYKNRDKQLRYIEDLHAVDICLDAENEILEDSLEQAQDISDLSFISGNSHTPCLSLKYE